MKKIISVFICVIITISFSLTAFAYDYSGGSRTALVNDFAELIPDDEEYTLNSKLEQISELYECEIAILTISSEVYTDITVFSDDYYDYNGFGYGENCDGIMLVVDIGNREFATTTCGIAINIFTDYNLNQLEYAFVNDLSAGNYTNAFIAFSEKCEEILSAYIYYQNNEDGYEHEDEGNAYTDNGYDYTDNGYVETDDDYYYDQPSSASDIFSVKWLGISVIIGLIIALIYTSSLKAQLKTVRSNPSASDYVIPGSMQLTQQRDVFMYRDVKKTPKPKSNSSSGRSGGSSFGSGSSTHTSSSGRSHGGSRGSF